MAVSPTEHGACLSLRRGLTEFRLRLSFTGIDLRVPIALAGKFPLSLIIRRIEKTFNLIDSLAGVIVTNLDEGSRVL